MNKDSDFVKIEHDKSVIDLHKQNHPDSTLINNQDQEAEVEMLTFAQFCNHFGVEEPDGYTEIVDAYIQYEHDCFHGGARGVNPEDYWSKENNTGDLKPIKV